jgi:hypothetical protein
MADEFFDRFAALAGGKVEPAAPEAAPAPPVPAQDAQFEPLHWVPMAMIGGGIMFMLLLLLL